VALGQLRFEQAIAAAYLEEARALRSEAEEILRELSEERFESNHPSHILLTRTLRWIELWENDPEKQRQELEKLSSEAEDFCAIHPGSERLIEVRDRIVAAYLRLATA
jgi:hypothetical protein